MYRLLTNLFTSRPTRRPVRPTKRPQLGLEKLDDRITPSGGGLNPNGTLSISGSNGNDRIIVTQLAQTGNSVQVQVEIRENGGAPLTLRFSGVKSIVCSCLDGDDYFVNNTQVSAFVYGGNGNDVLYGGGVYDRLYGENGNDALVGMGGDDILDGGNGNDILYGSNGNDTLYGGFGNDTLVGEAGNDQLFGDVGDDVLYGGDGNDTLYGGLGNDYLFGNAGRDFLAGNEGNDYLDGGRDGVADALYGGTGRDTFVTESVYIGGGLRNLDSPGDYSPYYEGDILR
jgi:Ca2+-binding RTX toxin-like protein